MSNNYFKVDEKQIVDQYNVKIPSENGLSYNSSQQIICHIDDSINFFNPQQTYLKIKVKINSELNTHLSLDPKIGGNVLIRTLRIVSGTGVELERIENYNTYVNLKYTYQDTPELESARILLEGAVGGSYNTRSPINQSSSGLINHGTDINSSLWGDDGSCTMTLPIHSGIFSSRHVYPNLYTQGLFLHFHLEDDYRCIRQNPKVRNLKQALRFQCVGTGDPANDTTWEVGTSTNSFFIKPNINLPTSQISEFPFKDGERFCFWSPDSNVENDPDDNDKVPMEAIDFFTIASTEIVGNYIKVTISADYDPTDAANDLAVNMFMISVEADVSVLADAVAPTYQVENCELVIGALNPLPNYIQDFQERLKDPDDGSTTFEMTSIQTYTQSLPANHTAGTMVLPLNNTMARSLICVPVNTYRPVWRAALNTKFMVGVVDDLNDYQFFYKNKYQPDRVVDCSSISKKAIAQQQISELRKALESGKIDCLNLLSYESNFSIGRAVALDGNICDLNNQDVQLNVRYTDPQINKNFHIFVIHDRDIVFSSSNMTIQV